MDSHGLSKSGPRFRCASSEKEKTDGLAGNASAKWNTALRREGS